MSIKILKFGGTSMGSSDSITQCADIILDTAKKNKPVVVVSALGGTTDNLIQLIENAKKQKPRLIAGGLNAIENRHKKILSAFVADEELSSIWEKEFAPSFKKLRYILTGISYVGELADKSYAVICSFGERLSSRIMYYAIIHSGSLARRVPAIRLVRTDSHYKEAEVDFQRTKINFKRIVAPLLKKGIVPVIDGFVGKDTSGDTTLLGRGGSDYTASIAAVSLGADSIEIWTDVDGIMSADPRLIKNPKIWSEIDVSVMAEMAYGGAKVLHPKMVIPALNNDIHVRIKNTFNRSARGTEIIKNGKYGLRGIVADKNQTLLHLTNVDMLDGVGFIQKCSEICTQHDVPIDVCATSEISFTLTIHRDDYTSQLKKSLEKIAQLENYDNVAKICIIGNNITHDPIFLASVFTSLSGYKIYTVSIGTSFNNVTLIVNQNNADKILKVLHKALF